MALKYEIDDLVEVPGNLRGEYVKADNGKFRLSLEGHPDKARLAEFRTNNGELRKTNDALTAKLAAFEGIDPDAARAALAKIEAGEGADVVKLKLQLAESQSAAASAAQRADALVHRHAVATEFVAIGGRPEAVDFMVSRAPFVVEGGELKPKEGAPPTLKEWLIAEMQASSFAFHPNKGGGAPGTKPGAVLGARSDVRTLRNPTAQELGAHAQDIAAGKVKVEITT